MSRCCKIRIFSQTKRIKTFYEQRPIILKPQSHKIIWIILKLEQNIQMLGIASKFLEVPFKSLELENINKDRKKGQNFMNKGQNLLKKYCSIYYVTTWD